MGTDYTRVIRGKAVTCPERSWASSTASMSVQMFWGSDGTAGSSWCIPTWWQCQCNVRNR